MQKFHAVSESVAINVSTNDDAGSRFDGRNNARYSVMLFHHPRFSFHLRKDGREMIIVSRMVFAGGANERFGRNFGNRNGAATGKRLVGGDPHASAVVRQLCNAPVA